MVQSMRRKLCGAIHVVKFLRCDLLQSMTINLAAIDWISMDWAVTICTAIGWIAIESTAIDWMAFDGIAIV